ncbi:hypothetical protein [Streptomyces sp. NPDC059816]|uniref:hypothetical protein n=1 Tax=Streptomyces sp. NPDC059816 TaxID=3346960 RepID=UPI00365B4100
MGELLSEALAALAAAGGTTVVQAAGTDLWAEIRRQVAGWFGRGDRERERAELERLDLSAAELTAVDDSDGDAVVVRVRQEALWQARFEMLLESLDGADREQAVAALRVLATGRTTGSASDGTVSGNTFHGPTAIMTGSDATQHNDFRQGA